MSAMQESGERAQLPERFGGFCQQVMSEWAGDDIGRLKHLACLTLRSAGWTYSQIGKAFGQPRQWAERHCRKARSQIREAFRGRDPRRDDEGFSDPGDPAEN